jgi:ammonia channel protein AmtB
LILIFLSSDDLLTFYFKVIGLLAYFATGYALSFGNGNAFCGTEYFGLIGLPDDQLALCFFQYTFAAAAATILSGPVQERTSLTAYICYTTLIAGRPTVLIIKTKSNKSYNEIAIIIIQII